jgi:hypothetical protein
LARLQDVHMDIKEDVQLQDMHEAAERFDPRTEEVFKYLQVGAQALLCWADDLGCQHAGHAQHLRRPSGGMPPSAVDRALR